MEESCQSSSEAQQSSATAKWCFGILKLSPRRPQAIAMASKCLEGEDTELYSASSSSSSSSLQSDTSFTTCTSSSYLSSDISFPSRRSRPLFDLDDEDMDLFFPISQPNDLTYRSRCTSVVLKFQSTSVDTSPLHRPLDKGSRPKAASLVKPTSAPTAAQRSLQSLLLSGAPYAATPSPSRSLFVSTPRLCPRDLACTSAIADHQTGTPALANVMLQTMSSPQLFSAPPDEHEEEQPARGRQRRGNAQHEKSAKEREPEAMLDLPGRLVNNSDQYRQLACEQSMMQVGKISRPLKTRAALNWTRRHPRMRRSPRSSLLRNVVLPS